MRDKKFESLFREKKLVTREGEPGGAEGAALLEGEPLKIQEELGELKNELDGQMAGKSEKKEKVTGSILDAEVEGLILDALRNPGSYVISILENDKITTKQLRASDVDIEELFNQPDKVEFRVRTADGQTEKGRLFIEINPEEKIVRLKKWGAGAAKSDNKEFIYPFDEIKRDTPTKILLTELLKNVEEY